MLIPNNLANKIYIEEVPKDNKLYLLYYDNPKNENLTEHNNQIKVKSIPDNDEQDLYMTTIDENNKINLTLSALKMMNNIYNLFTSIHIF